MILQLKPTHAFCRINEKATDEYYNYYIGRIRSISFIGGGIRIILAPVFKTETPNSLLVEKISEKVFNFSNCHIHHDNLNNLVIERISSRGDHIFLSNDPVDEERFEKFNKS